MEGKLQFGCDYVYMMRDLVLRGSKEISPIPDAALKYFLLNWDFSPEEVDKADSLFYDKLNNEKLENLDLVIKRITDLIKNDRAAQERLVTQLAAIGYLDYDVKDAEAFIVRYLSDAFDFRPSEFEKFAIKGANLAIGLNFFGEAYMKEKNQTK